MTRVQETLAMRWNECEDIHRQGGRAWYPQAAEWVRTLAAQCNLWRAQVAGVASVLSPSVEWSVTQLETEWLCRVWAAGGNLGKVTLTTYRPQCRKAHRLLQSGVRRMKDVLEMVGTERALKTRAFCQVLFDPGAGVVVVDRWMVRAAGLPGDKANKGQYREVEAAIRNLAEASGELPSAVQATIWLYVKEVGEGRTTRGQQDLPF